MTKMIHDSPEDGAVTLSSSANSQLISEIRPHACKTCVGLTCEPGAHVVTAVMLTVEKLLHMLYLYRSNFVLRALARKTS